MALLKFMTVYDDDCGQILKHQKLYSYDLSAYPTVYFANGKPYYDNINSNSIMYTKFIEKGQASSKPPTIPSSVFEEEFRRAYDNGYIGVVVICPHAKWTPYYSNARLAAKRFYKSVEVDEMGFRIEVVNSYTFAAGTMYLALTFANWYSSFHQPTDYFFNFIKYNIKYSYTFILAHGKTVLGDCEKYSAYMLSRSKIEKLDICKYTEEVMYDKFATLICDFMKSKDRTYLVSMGNSCYFAPNVLGRIESFSGKEPLGAIQYSAATIGVLGSKAICISLV